MKTVHLALVSFFMVAPLLAVTRQQPSQSIQEFAAQLVQATDQASRSALLKEKGDVVGQPLAQALNEAVDKLIGQKQFAQAIEIAAFAQAIAIQVQAKKETADAINLRGRAYYSLSQFDEALTYFQQALEMRRQLPGQLELAQSLNNMASCYQVKSLYSLALNYQEQSLTIKQQLAQAGDKSEKLKKSIADSHINIGIFYRYLGNYTLALEHFQQSFQLNEALKNLASLASLANAIGVVYSEQEQFDRALEQFQQSLKFNRDSALPDRELQAQTLNNLGLLYWQNKKYELALAACRESLRLREALKNKERLARTQRRLAMIYLAQNNLSEALQLAQAAGQSSQQHTETFWQARLIEGKVQIALKHFPEAEQCFAEAIQTIEAMRTQAPKSPETQQRFFENKISPYLEMTGLLLMQTRRLEALAYAERTKARVILDLIQTSQVPRANSDAAAVLPALIASAPLTLAELTALVPTADTILLEFVIVNEKVHLFALTKANAQAPAELQTISLEISATKLTERVQTFRRAVAERKLSFAASAQALYQQLLKPVSGLLRQKKNVVIVPDGLLWELPFQALMPADNHYLWQDYTIFYAPSLTALREITKRHANRKPTNAAMTLLALGNPTIASNAPSELTPATLTYAEHQVQQLRQIYGPNASKVLTGTAATEAAFKVEASKYSVLHLATHGIYDNRHPLSSRVLLAATDSEDGNVEAQEIINLKLTNELIVLSACETGRGHIGPGEGVIGLTWAFLIAGCPTLVASQWEVRDDSTSRLMSNFHRALKTTQQPRAEALRQAALSLLKSPQYKHPYYWAGFVLIGDGY